jgi:hypothetical protein
MGTGNDWFLRAVTAEEEGGKEGGGIWRKVVGKKSLIGSPSSASSEVEWAEKSFTSRFFVRNILESFYLQLSLLD